MSESQYVADMEAAILPEIRDLLARQFDAFYAVALKHTKHERGKEPVELRALDRAFARLSMLADEAARGGYERARAPKLGAWVEIAEIPTRNDEVTHTQTALEAFRRAVADLGGAATERDHGTDERTARSAQVLDPVTGARIGEVEILVDRQRSALVVRVRRGAP